MPREKERGLTTRRRGADTNRSPTAPTNARRWHTQYLGTSACLGAITIGDAWLDNGIHSKRHAQRSEENADESEFHTESCA